MPCKFRIDLEEEVLKLEESLLRLEFDISKYDWIRDRKNSDYQILCSKQRKTKELLKSYDSKIKELAEVDEDLEACEKLDKTYDEMMKENPKKIPEKRSDKDLAEDLFKELGLE